MHGHDEACRSRWPTGCRNSCCALMYGSSNCILRPSCVHRKVSSSFRGSKSSRLACSKKTLSPKSCQLKLGPSRCLMWLSMAAAMPQLNSWLSISSCTVVMTSSRTAPRICSMAGKAGSDTDLVCWKAVQRCSRVGVITTSGVMAYSGHTDQ